MTVQLQCDARRCKPKEPVAGYPHGIYCPRHARMMAPRSQWAALGVPEPPAITTTPPKEKAA